MHLPPRWNGEARLHGLGIWRSGVSCTIQTPRAKREACQEQRVAQIFLLRLVSSHDPEKGRNSVRVCLSVCVQECAGRKPFCESMSSTYRQRLQLKDVWHAARTERHFDYVFWTHVVLDIMADAVLKNFGYCLVVLACVLISVLVTAGFTFVLPAVISPGSFTYCCHFCFGLFAAFCIIYNYYRAVTTKPGCPTDFVPETFLGEHFCKKCNYPKPERAHHCSVCNQCVMRMDHHCPWLSNCVGLKNYRFFVCFLFWVTLGTFYLSALCLPRVLSDGLLPSPFTAAHNVRAYFQWSTPSSPAPAAAEHSHPHHASVYKEIFEKYREKKYLRNHSPPAHASHRRLQLVDAVAGNLSHSFQLDYVNLSFPLLASWETVREEIHQHLEHTRVYNSSWIAVLAPAMHRSPRRQLQLLHEELRTWSDVWEEDSLVFLAVFMVAAGVCLATGTLLSLHLYLVCTNQTTVELFTARIEQARGVHSNPYDKGMRENLREVMGTDSWWLAFWPTFSEVPDVVEEWRESRACQRYCCANWI